MIGGDNLPPAEKISEKVLLCSMIYVIMDSLNAAALNNVLEVTKMTKQSNYNAVTARCCYDAFPRAARCGFLIMHQNIM